MNAETKLEFLFSLMLLTLLFLLISFLYPSFTLFLSIGLAVLFITMCFGFTLIYQGMKGNL